jgi:hypothetical protein
MLERIGEVSRRGGEHVHQIAAIDGPNVYTFTFMSK